MAGGCATGGAAVGALAIGTCACPRLRKSSTHALTAAPRIVRISSLSKRQYHNSAWKCKESRRHEVKCSSDLKVRWPNSNRGLPDVLGAKSLEPLNHLFRR